MSRTQMLERIGYADDHEFVTDDLAKLVRRYAGADMAQLEAYKAELGWNLPHPAKPAPAGGAHRDAPKRAS